MPKKSLKTVLPDPLPRGEVLTDIGKNKWCLGPSIGKGGFGEIYSAAKYDGNKKNLTYEFVVKIEPHGNGPLFCEMHFFMRNAKPDMIKNWCSDKKLPVLGIPRYLGSGSHEHGGNKYRFLVMDKYGKDLWNIFLENKKTFPVHTVFRLGLQLIDSLEYIHSNGYCHADLKGANILLGLTKQTQNQAFLVDFGLASKYSQKEFKPDPKKAHNGTIEYTSRDAHDGVPTRRSDIEILGYNLVQWMGCVLPWEKNLSDPVVVQKSKKKYMDDITSFMSSCFGKKKPPAALVDFLQYVAQMSHDTEPDYKKIRTILTKGLKTSGGSSTGQLEFKITKHKTDTSDTDTPEKKPKLTPRRTPRNTPKQPTDSDDDEYFTPEVKIKRPAPKRENKGRSKTTKIVELDSDSDEVNSNTNGYNAEMLRLQKKIAERNKTTNTKKTKKNSSASSGSGVSTPIDYIDDVIEGTPPEIINGVRRKIRNTPRSNGTKGDDDIPTGRRLRR